MFLGHNVKTSKQSVEPVDTSGLDIVIKALKDLVTLKCCRIIGRTTIIACPEAKGVGEATAFYFFLFFFPWPRCSVISQH